MFPHPFLNVLVIFGASYLIFIMAAIVGWEAVVKKWYGHSEWIRYVLLSGVLAFAASRIADALYSNPRPFVQDHFIPLIAHGTDNGFPSSHTLLAAFLTAAVWPYNRRLGKLLGVLTVLVAASRVYAGVHHVADVVASVVIVAFCAWIAWRFCRPGKR